MKSSSALCAARRSRSRALVTLCAVAAACLAVTSSLATAAPHAHAGKSPFSLRLERKFSVLARRQGPLQQSIAVPSNLITAFGDAPGLQRYDPQPAKALSVVVSPSFTAWLVPAAQGICLFATLPTDAGLPARLDGTYFATCRTTANATDGHSLSDENVGEPGGVLWQRVWGLAPNGDSDVTVTRSDGTSATVPVTDNVYVAYGTATARITSVSLADAGATATTELGPS